MSVWRWVRGALLSAVVTLGCSGPSARPRTNVARARPPSAPLPTEANRNAPPPVVLEGSGVELQRLVLWCSQPTGSACTAAQQELGLPPAPTPAIPQLLLEGARDSEDDCADPDLAPLMQRVTAALGAGGGGWADQGGQIVDRALLADLYTGSGCTNAAMPADPPLKIHVVDHEGEPHFLVRVWEVGETF